MGPDVAVDVSTTAAPPACHHPAAGPRGPRAPPPGREGCPERCQNGRVIRVEGHRHESSGHSRRLDPACVPRTRVVGRTRRGGRPAASARRSRLASGVDRAVRRVSKTLNVTVDPASARNRRTHGDGAATRTSPPAAAARRWLSVSTRRPEASMKVTPLSANTTNVGSWRTASITSASAWMSSISPSTPSTSQRPDLRRRIRTADGIGSDRGVWSSLRTVSCWLCGDVMTLPLQHRDRWRSPAT